MSQKSIRDGWKIVAGHKHEPTHGITASQRQRDCHQRSPGVAEHHGIAHSKLIKSLLEQGSLRCGRPDARARTVAVAKSWPVEANDAIVVGQSVDQTA